MEMDAWPYVYIASPAVTLSRNNTAEKANMAERLLCGAADEQTPLLHSGDLIQ